jgi:hypothetical protein
MLTNYAYLFYCFFHFVPSIQPKPKCEREHDIMEPNARPPSEQPKNLDVKLKLQLVASSTGGCSTYLKNNGIRSC